MATLSRRKMRWVRDDAKRLFVFEGSSSTNPMGAGLVVFLALAWCLLVIGISLCLVPWLSQWLSPMMILSFMVACIIVGGAAVYAGVRVLTTLHRIGVQGGEWVWEERVLSRCNRRLVLPVDSLRRVTLHWEFYVSRSAKYFPGLQVELDAGSPGPPHRV